MVENLQIFHINVNCSDLERSIEFYNAIGFKEFLSLERGGQAPPPTRPGAGPGPGPGLRLPDSKSRAHIMTLGNHPRATRLDLIEWVEPRDREKPYAEMGHLGIVRIAFKVRDIRSAYDTLKPQGVAFSDEPQDIYLGSGHQRVAYFRDPDGTILEFLQFMKNGDEGRPGASDASAERPMTENTLQMFHVNVNCSDLDRSLAFYKRIGFREFLTLEQPAQGAAVDGGGKREYTRERARILTLGDAPRATRLDLIERRDAEERPYPHLARLGIARIAFKVKAIDRAYEELKAEGVEFFTPPYDIYLGGGHQRFCCFTDPDGAVLEFLEFFRD